MGTSTPKGQKRSLDALELSLQAVVSHLMHRLAIEHLSPAKSSESS